MTAAAILLSAVVLAASREEAASGPTFCAEWVTQSREGYDRLTLFRDNTLVWKTSRNGEDKVRRQKMEEAEGRFYCGFFARAEFWSIPQDLRSGLGGQFVAQAAVTLARPNGQRHTVRFDDLSSHTADSAALRSALEGLRGIFLSPLASPERYTAARLPPETLLKRFDGAVFRVVRIEKEKGFVEIRGVTEPYSQFLPLEELRFQFAPPE